MRDEARDLVALADYLTPNETETERLSGVVVRGAESAAAAARALRSRGAGTVIVKLGAQGALACAADGLVRAPALPVAVVDTIAAGDAFNAGLAVAPSRRCPGGTRSRRCSAREAPPRRGSTVAEPRLERPHPGERRLDALGVEPAAHEALLNRREGGPSGRAAVGKAIVGDEQDVSARREGRDGRGLEPPALLDRAHPEIVGHDRPVEAELAAEEPGEGRARERGGEPGAEPHDLAALGVHRDQERPPGARAGALGQRAREAPRLLVARDVPREEDDAADPCLTEEWLDRLVSLGLRALEADEQELAQVGLERGETHRLERRISAAD